MTHRLDRDADSRVEEIGVEAIAQFEDGFAQVGEQHGAAVIFGIDASERKR